MPKNMHLEKNNQSESATEESQGALDNNESAQRKDLPALRGSLDAFFELQYPQRLET